MPGKVDLTELKNVIPYVGSITQSDSTKNKSIGLLENVTHKIRQGFNQICNLFVEFRWVNDEKIQKKINNKIVEFNDRLNGNGAAPKNNRLKEADLVLMNDRVKEMKEICKLISSSTSKTKTVDAIDRQLGAMEGYLTRKIAALKNKIYEPKDNRLTPILEVEKNVKIAEKEKAALVKEAEQLNSSVDELKAKIENVEKQLATYQKQELSTQETIANLQKEIIAGKQQLTNAEQGIQEGRKKNNEKKSKILEQQTLISNKDLAIQQSQAGKNKFQNKYIEKKASFKKLEEKPSQNQNLDSLVLLKQQIEEAEGELKKIKKELSKKDAEIAKKDLTISEKDKALESIINKKNELKKKYNEKKKSLEVLAADLKQKELIEEKRLAKFTKKNQKLEMQLAAATKKQQKIQEAQKETQAVIAQKEEKLAIVEEKQAVNELGIATAVSKIKSQKKLLKQKNQEAEPPKVTLEAYSTPPELEPAIIPQQEQEDAIFPLIQGEQKEIQEVIAQNEEKLAIAEEKQTVNELAIERTESQIKSQKNLLKKKKQNVEPTKVIFEADYTPPKLELAIIPQQEQEGAIIQLREGNKKIRPSRLLRPLNKIDLSRPIPGLTQLLKAENNQGITNELVIKAHQVYKQSEIGVAHRVSKFASSIIAYGVVVGGTGALTVGGGYWLVTSIDDPIGLATNVTKTIFGAATANPGYSSIGLLTSIAGLGGASKWITGVNFRKVATIGTLLALTTAVSYAASQAGNMVADKHDRTEKQKNEQRIKAKATMFEEMKNIFKSSAEELTEIGINQQNPKVLVIANTIAEQLESKLPFFRKHLATYELDELEIAQILQGLITAVQSIRANSIGFQGGNSDYNMKLLSIMSNEQLISIISSKSLRKHVLSEEPKGVMNILTVRGLKKTVGELIGAGLVVAIPSIFAIAGKTFYPNLLGTIISQSLDSTPFAPYTTPLSIAGELIVGLGIITPFAWMAKQKYSKGMQEIVNESQKSAVVKPEFIQEVTNNYKTVFDGIALSMNELYEHFPENIGEIAQGIEEKIPTIEAALDVLGLGEVTDRVLENLKTVLGELLPAQS